MSWLYQTLTQRTSLYFTEKNNILSCSKSVSGLTDYSKMMIREDFPSISCSVCLQQLVAGWLSYSLWLRDGIKVEQFREEGANKRKQDFLCSRDNLYLTSSPPLHIIRLAQICSQHSKKKLEKPTFVRIYLIMIVGTINQTKEKIYPGYHW